MRLRTAVAGLAAAAVLAACGSGTAPTTPQETGTSPAESSGHGSYAQCLDDRGVPAPPGPVSAPPPGVDEQTWKDAMASCASLAPGPA